MLSKNQLGFLYMFLSVCTLSISAKTFSIVSKYILSFVTSFAFLYSLFNSFEFLHRNKILFIYVLDGSIKLIDDITEHSLSMNDCFTLPPNKKFSLFYLKTIKLLLLSISGKLDIKVFK